MTELATILQQTKLPGTWCAALCGVSYRSWRYMVTGERNGRPVATPARVLLTMRLIAETIAAVKGLP